MGSRSRFRSVVCAALALAVVAVPAAPAEAARWSSATITYRDHAGIPKTVREAVRLWNRTVRGLRLVPAKRGRRAMIRIFERTGTRCGAIGCGFYPPNGTVELARGWLRAPDISPIDAPALRPRPIDQPLDDSRVGVVAHEIGHALGLPHTNDPCDLMHPVYGRCRGGLARGAGQIRCGPQQRDARALARLYRRKARKVSGRCQVVPEPRAELGGAGPFVVTGAAAVDGFTREVSVPVRNRSSRTWGAGPGRLRVQLTAVAPTPDELAALCGTGTYELAGPAVPPGQVGTVRIGVCGSGTVRVRLRPEAVPGETDLLFQGTSRWGPVLGPVEVGLDAPPRAELLHGGSGARETTFFVRASDDLGVASAVLDFGDGTSAAVTGGSVPHAYPGPGTYTATLAVRDGRGQVATSAVTVVVEPDPPPPPPDDPPPPEEPFPER